MTIEWHEQQEIILKKWAETSSSYRYLHDRSYLLYSQKNLWFAIPVIVISTITGTANFAQSSFPESIKSYAPSIIGTFNLIAGLITTIAQFLRVSELLESHRVASISFGKLARNISVELSLPVKERNSNGSEFLSQCRNEIDKLIEQSPNIPLSILKQFEEKFKNHNFIKPDILDITSVDIYVNNEEEEFERKQKIATKQLELRQKIIEDEKKKQLESYNIIKKLKKSNKKLVNTGTVHKSLDKLITSFKIDHTPFTDSTDDSDDSIVENVINESNNQNENNIIEEVTSDTINDIITKIDE